MWWISILFGTVVGFALGLTGGGGSIFAVPMLVYGVQIGAHQAVGISLAAVGATAAVGLLQRLHRGEVEVATGLLFALAGMIAAPLGAWLNSYFPPDLLLMLFSALMVAVAARMWKQAVERPSDATAVRSPIHSPAETEAKGPVCRRDPEGRLMMTSPCAVMLVGLGLMTGLLSGMFGVGGGFLIVPALVLFSGMEIHRAVATSLLVIALVSLSGTAAYWVAGRDIDWQVTGLFVGGGVLGMWLGTLTGGRIAGPTLQKIFAAAIVSVALFIVIQNLWQSG